MSYMPYLSIAIPDRPGPVYHVGRDPFARGEYHRESIGDHGRCTWCGRESRVLYRYGWEPDSATGCAAVRLSPHAFCSLPCHVAYHS